jgi:GR25 family glycosyltransferase involved in LPS biosynthesis
MEEQLRPFPFTSLYYKGYTPKDCTSYINYKHPVLPEEDTTLSCTRSHIGVLKHFLEHSEKQVVLVLEDDLLFCKDFMTRLTHVLEVWNKHISEIDYVSIGYGPSDINISNKTDDVLNWDLFCNNGSVWGTLGYLVKRSIAEDMVRCFDTPTVSSLYQALYTKIKANGTLYSRKSIRAQADVVFSVCWRQAFIKPMLVIESPLFSSTITITDSNSNTRGWNKAFQRGELKVDHFAPCCELYLR